MDSVVVVELCVPVFEAVLFWDKGRRGGKMLTWHLHFQRHSRLFGSILLSTIILSADNHSKGVGWRGCDNKEEDCAASWLLAASGAGVAS